MNCFSANSGSFNPDPVTTHTIVLFFILCGFIKFVLINPSKDAADAQDKSWTGYQSAYDAHMDSANKSKSEATLSLVTALAAVGYGYYIGVFSEEE